MFSLLILAVPIMPQPSQLKCPPKFTKVFNTKPSPIFFVLDTLTNSPSSDLILTGQGPYLSTLNFFCIYQFVHLGSLNIVMKCVGIADNTVFTNSSVLGYDRKFLFHPSSLLPIFYIRGCMVDLVGFLMFSGNPM
jgi:hypothetical protein